MSVPNSLSELRRVSAWIRGFALEHELAQRPTYWLELTVNEALANIMNYAYRDGSRHDIIVELNARPDRLSIRIEDDGIPFNPLEAPTEEQSASLEKSRPAGRGIQLMRSIMDELHYQRSDGRNVLTMILNYPGA